MEHGEQHQAMPPLVKGPCLAEGETAGDGELLEGFLRRGDQAAFAALVRRHGPMVLGVCRRILHDHHDAEDAFQATFLVLVRRAECVQPADAVGSWLYGVAYRTAVKAKALAIRRQAKEQMARERTEAARRTAPSRNSGRSWIRK